MDVLVFSPSEGAISWWFSGEDVERSVRYKLGIVEWEGVPVCFGRGTRERDSQREWMRVDDGSMTGEKAHLLELDHPPLKISRTRGLFRVERRDDEKAGNRQRVSEPVS